LQSIALDLAAKLAACSTESERDAVRDEFVGFFASSEEAIMLLTKSLQLRALDQVSYEDLSKQLAAACELDEEETSAKFVRRARSDTARQGWFTLRRCAPSAA
jgi:hypothetical protein